MYTDAVIGPHAVMIHQHNALVADAAVVGAKRLNKLAFEAEDALWFGNVLTVSKLEKCFRIAYS